MFRQLRPFHQRLIVSSAGIILLLFLTYLSLFPTFQPVFALTIGCIISIALWEFYRLTGMKGFEPLVVLGVLGSVAYTLAFYLKFEFPYAKYAPQIVLYFLLVLGFLYYFVQGKQPLINLALTIFGIAYITIPLSFSLPINFYHGSEGVGPLWFLYLLAVVKMTDIGAYVAGKQLGKNLMAPIISPKKTWEGALGGFILGIFASLLYFACLGSKMKIGDALTSWTALWLGGILSIASQFGDLAESLIKRDAGVKDSNQLPGLGGVLDIVDSLIFAFPILYLFLSFQKG